MEQAVRRDIAAGRKFCVTGTPVFYLGVVSADGEGSTFWFTLPLARGKPLETSLVPRAPLGEVKVLIVEDNVVNQMIAVAMFEKFGCKVDVAADGVEGVEHFERNSYDLILMDCQMPNMDGYEATQAIRKLEGHTSHVPIVAMTAHAMAGDRERCLAAGMDDYISKPVSPGSCKTALDAWAPLEIPSKTG